MIIMDVTANELKRWLSKKGCTFEDGKKHTMVMRGDRFSFIPRHPKKEIKTGTLKSILKDLDLRLPG